MANTKKKVPTATHLVISCLVRILAIRFYIKKKTRPISSKENVDKTFFVCLSTQKSKTIIIIIIVSRLIHYDRNFYAL